MNFLNLVQGAAGKVKGVATLLSGLTKTQAIIAGVATVTAVGGVGTGGYFLYDHFHQPEPIVADVVISTEGAEEPTEEVVAVEEVVTEETEAAEPETVTLVGSSIEKDLKIKIQDESSKNVKGQPFEITVKGEQKKAKAATYMDDDKDGIIYIKSIEAGKYDVSLNEIDGYISKENSYKLTVKDKIEYTKVDVKDEIKSASEVAPAEDAEVDNVEVEAVIQDTVETVDSTCTPAKVSGADVDTSNFNASQPASSGTNTVNIAQGATTTAKARSYRAAENLSVITEGGTDQNPSNPDGAGGDQEQKPDDSVQYTINHVFSDNATFGPDTGSGKVGDKIKATDYSGHGYTAEGSLEFTLKEGENTFTVNWKKKESTETKEKIKYTITNKCGDKVLNTISDEAEVGTKITVKNPDPSIYEKDTQEVTLISGQTNYDVNWTEKQAATVTYTIKHYFNGKEDATKAESKSGAVGATVKATDYSKDYTTTDKTEFALDADASKNIFEVKWTTKAAAATASVSIPKSVTLYNNASANSLAISTSITDAGAIIKGISWSSSNSKVVQISKDSKSGCTLTAAGLGDASITATVTYLSKPGDKKTTATATVSCAVSVKQFSTDSTAQLKDKSGRLLYKDSECKKPATVADYNANGTYYTEPVYTGWQTIDGKVYYYTSNHQRVTGSQVISGISYNFGSDGALQQGSGKNGIDVSSHQGNIDWASVKAAGINFAIIRVGYRGSQTGALVEDSCFKKNIQGATANGINVGVYFFTQATTEAEAVEEASMALTLCSGYNLSYPIFVDTENGSGAARANGLDKGSRTACVAAFCKTIANGGRKAGVYASKSWYNNKIDASAFSNYFIWVAQYNTTCNYKGKYNMWQYSSKGSVPGIKGNVDVNIAY